MVARRMLPVFVGVMLVASAFVFAANTNVTAKSGQRNTPKIRMLTPQKGDVFHPGDRVMITWEYVKGNGAPGPVDTTWCEQEIYLSIDGGRTLARQLTGTLDPSLRSFEWIVPDLPSEKAVLDIHFGCEADGYPTERPNVQLHAPFRILPADKNIEGITMDRIPKQVHPGDSLTISWNSTVVDAGPYQVFVSYDRGGDFVELGATNATAFTWTIPSQYTGPLVFRISTKKNDGTTIESALDPKSATMVK